MTEFEQSVERYLFLNSTFFPQEKVSQIKDKLLSNESVFNRARLMTLKDPNTLLLISVFVGQLGVDRFLINKKATGALKLIFWIIALVIKFGIVPKICMNHINMIDNYKKDNELTEFNWDNIICL